MATNQYQNELFEKLNAAFAKDKKENSRKEILKLVPEKTYIVRLIPNLDDPTKTFKNFYLHGWNSESDGKYISATCPTTFAEECPICKEYFRLYNKGTDEAKETAKLIKRKQRLFTNVYVVDDPTNPENNNTVKILSYGQQLEKVINDAWEGDDKDEVGLRMFDFSENGCNLRIKVEKNQGGFPVYTASRFLAPSPIAVKLDAIKDQIHDLDALVKVKSKAELVNMIAEGLYGETVEKEEHPVVAKAQPATRPVAQPTPVAEVADDAGGDDVLASLQKYITE